ncbi:MAG: vWA domain-containing protein, partial [Planctomycetota bacterium]
MKRLRRTTLLALLLPGAMILPHVLFRLSNRFRFEGLLLCGLLLFGPLTASLQAAPADDSVRNLSEVQTRSLVRRYEDAKHWSLKSIVLLALGEKWHPVGASIVVSALQDKDPHLQAYGLAALQATDPEHLKMVATPELVQALIEDAFDVKEGEFRSDVNALLTALFPDAKADKQRKWSRHWKSLEEGYSPVPWVGPEPTSAGGERSSSAKMIERAMDLYEAGLEVCICIDSTGSMQPTIDAARDAVSDIVSMLRGVAPQFKLGLVHYKDFGDMGRVPAKILEPLSRKPAAIEKKLSRLGAGGGGDLPERVEVGLELALSEEMKWQRTTNKLVVVISDAPDHGGEARAKALKLAGDAYKKPFGVDPTDIQPKKRSGRSGTNQIVRPFVTATIAVGMDRFEAGTEASLKEIAKAGGGAFAKFLTSKTSPTEAST